MNGAATFARRLARLEGRREWHRPAREFAADPVGLARAVGLDPDPWQVALLVSKARQILLLASRQSGKSTVTALLALHTILYRDHSLVLTLAPSQRQSQELFRKIRTAYAALGTAAVPAREETALTLTLTNGSRVVCLPGTEHTVRGYSGAALILVDEAARVPDPLYQAIRPMLAVSGGRIVLLSTPFGRRGFFFQEWDKGADWERLQIRATDCPRIAPEWLAAERAAIGDFWFSQEYQTEFRETEDQVFSYDLIMAAMDPTLPPLFTPADPVSPRRLPAEMAAF